MTKHITLPCHGIEIKVLDSNLGTIVSNLHSNPPRDYDASNDPFDNESAFEGAIHALESMILACACAGVDVQSPKFIEAINTTVDAIGNQYGE